MIYGYMDGGSYHGVYLTIKYIYIYIIIIYKLIRHEQVNWLRGSYILSCQILINLSMVLLIMWFNIKIKISVITDISEIYQLIFWYKILINLKLIKTYENIKQNSHKWN